MGLRERNAAQTRTLILDTALDLFVEQGDEATRMEEIAQRADIGASTFRDRLLPSKELLVTGLSPPWTDGGRAADDLDEPLDLALGHALTALLTTPRPDTARLRQPLAILDSAPAARARLLQEAVDERIGLERAIEERLRRPRGDLFCTVTARITMSVLELVADDRHPVGAAENAAAAQEAVTALRHLLEQLRDDPPVLPFLVE